VITPDKEYEFVSSQVRYHNEKIIEAFNLFIKLFSAIVGGSIWLRLQPGFDAAQALAFARMSSLLVVFLTAIAGLMVAENLKSWHGYRWAQARLGGVDEKGHFRIPPPRTFRASVCEGAMMLTMVAAAILYWLFNPFTL
jgi:hypothetical protein